MDENREWFLKDFYWAPLKTPLKTHLKIKNLEKIHQELGEQIKLALEGKKEAVESIKDYLIRGLEISGITMLWIQRLDLLLCLFSYLGEKGVLDFINELISLSNDEVVKFNLLNPTVVDCLYCANIETGYKINIPQHYKRYKGVDGICVLYFPEGYQSCLM